MRSRKITLAAWRREKEQARYGGYMQARAALVAGTVEVACRPNLVLGESLTRPVPGATVEALRENDVVAVASTDDAGRYELRIQPGTYRVRASAGGQSIRERRKTVTIGPGETLTVRFVFDTIPMIR